MRFRCAHLIGVLSAIGISPEHGITGTASRGDLEGPRSSRQQSGNCIFSRHEAPEHGSGSRRHLSTIGAGSATELAREVAKRGIRTLRGNRVDKKYLYRMLSNRAYLGEAVHKGDSYPGEHDAIIDREKWDRVHAILQESPRKRAARTRAETPALLKGLLFGPDGAAFSPTHTRRGARLRKNRLTGRARGHRALRRWLEASGRSMRSRR